MEEQNSFPSISPPSPSTKSKWKKLSTSQGFSQLEHEIKNENENERVRTISSFLKNLHNKEEDYEQVSEIISIQEIKYFDTSLDFNKNQKQSAQVSFLFKILFNNLREARNQMKEQIESLKRNHLDQLNFAKIKISQLLLNYQTLLKNKELQIKQLNLQLKQAQLNAQQLELRLSQKQYSRKKYQQKVKNQKNSKIEDYCKKMHCVLNTFQGKIHSLEEKASDKKINSNVVLKVKNELKDVQDEFYQTNLYEESAQKKKRFMRTIGHQEMSSEYQMNSFKEKMSKTFRENNSSYIKSPGTSSVKGLNKVNSKKKFEEHKQNKLKGIQTVAAYFGYMR